LGRVVSHWEEPGLFEADAANLVGTWCVDYYQRTGHAPGKGIEILFHRWGETDARDDDKKIEVVQRLLSSLSGEYDRMAQTTNADFLTDIAADIFNATRVRRKMKLVEGDLAKGDVKKALTRWEETKPFELGQGGWIDPVADTEAQDEAFREQGKSVIAYKGAFGRFMDTALELDGFVGLLGSEKRGKSYWLLEFAWKAMIQGLEVAYFEVGDLSRAQVMRRIYRKAARRPFRAGEFLYPVELTWDGKSAVVKQEEYKFDRPMTREEGADALASVTRKLGGKSGMRLSCHPSMSITTGGIRSILLRWARDGYNPKVVVIDYADILAATNGKESTRDQINRNWGNLRQMSQEFHCLLLTATQADAASYDSELLKKNNFSEDKRKYGHVTAMFGLNQNETEKREGRYRLNLLVGREIDWGENEVCHVAGSLAICSPMLKAIWRGET
jgi:hypothetical protein